LPRAATAGPARQAQTRRGVDKRLAVVETWCSAPRNGLLLVRVGDTERLILLGEGREIDPPAPIPNREPSMRRCFRACRRRPQALWLSLVVTAKLVLPTSRWPSRQRRLGNGAGLTERVVQLIALVTVRRWRLDRDHDHLVRAHHRVLSLLRTALGLQQSPPNAVLVSLSLFLTAS